MKRILLVKFVILFVFSLPVYVMGQGTELFTVKVQQDGNTIGSNGSIYLLDKDNFSLKLTSRNDSCLKLKTELNGIIATSETEVTLNHEESGNLYFELRGNGKATITVTPYFCKRENKPGESFSITFGKKASSVKTATESSTSTVIPAPNPKSQPTPTKTTQTSAKTPEGENPEEKAKKAWDKLTASKQNSYCDYQNFINSYPNSKNKVDAENKIAGIKSDTIRYSCALDPKEKRVDFTLNAVMAPHISSISGALRENIDSSQLNCGRFSIRGATSMENLIIEIYDSLKTNGVRYRKIDLDVSKAIQVSIDTGRTGIIFISVIRGIKPYTLSVDTFRRDFQDTISISIEELQNKNIVGTVHFQVYDSQDAGRAFDKEIPKKPWFKWYYIAIPILIFLMGLLYLLKKKKEKERAKHKKEEWDKKKEEQKLPLLINTLSEDTQKDEHSPIQPIDDPNKQGMIIKPRIRAEKSIMVLDDDEKLPFSTTDYLEIPVHNTWDDSCVQAIYMNSPSISKLDSFLRTQSSAFIEEQDDKTPEIGGLLLGNVFMTKKNQDYIIQIEEFIPIKPETHDKFQLEFSTTSITKELGDLQDNYPNLLLVGWFHTHPGHGLFLSKPDLTIQNGFFTQPYQFAMEIDSLTENLDTGFFTRKKDATINNMPYRKVGASWFVWTEIEKFTRKRK